MHTPERNTAWNLVLKTALDAVVIMDCEGNVVDWNDNATTVFGWTAEEVRGRLMAEFIIPARLRETHARGLARFLATGEAKVLGQRIEIWGLRRTGEEFPIELSISPVTESGGLIFVGFFVTLVNGVPLNGNGSSTPQDGGALSGHFSCG